MSLVTYLPNVSYAFRNQITMFDRGDLCQKAKFVTIMLMISGASFVVRLFLVYKSGWIDIADGLITPMPCKVIFAILLPPAVDGLQSVLFILAGIKDSGGNSGVS